MTTALKQGQVHAGPGTAKPKSADTSPGPGFRILSDFRRPNPELVSNLSTFATPDISDELNRLYAPDAEIRCLTSPTHKLAGAISTVRVYPADNLMIHKVLDIARPGDVVVVHGGQHSRTAVLGDLVARKAKHRSIAGFIVDGYIRDLPDIEPLDMPVFARGTTPVGPLHRGPGEINYPISCGGVVVNPGDIAIADQAGIVIVPHGFADELLARLTAQRNKSRSYLRAVQKGTWSNEWVDQILSTTGCQINAEGPNDA